MAIKGMTTVDREILGLLHEGDTKWIEKYPHGWSHGRLDLDDYILRLICPSSVFDKESAANYMANLNL